MNYLPSTSSVAVQVRPTDRWISRTAAATVAGALSYSHMRQLAQDHGQPGWHAHAFPLSVDGIEIVASLVLLADRRAGHRSGWLPWTALAAGTIGSLAANIATAHPDPVSRVIAGWPALALLLAVKLLAGLLEHQPSPDDYAPPPLTPRRQATRPRPLARPLPPQVTVQTSPQPTRARQQHGPTGQNLQTSSHHRLRWRPTQHPTVALTCSSPPPESPKTPSTRTARPSPKTPSPPASASTATQSATPASHHYSASSAASKPTHLAA